MRKPQPIRWTVEQLADSLSTAIEHFRTERLGEPHQQYLDYFDKAHTAAVRIFELTDDLVDLGKHASLLLSDPNLVDVSRYLSSPPISRDDLETIAGYTMAATLVTREPDRASALLDVIAYGLDERRFPWVKERRPPQPEERKTAIVATAAMLAFRQVETTRRNRGKDEQEDSVKTFLTDHCDFTEAPARPIPSLAEAPLPGEFCGESEVGSRKADIVVRLRDGRLMPIECKVSNSVTNSYKRINNDAAVKAVVWRHEFGEVNIVPAAVLSGVFALKNLEYAQEHDLSLFWAHDLTALKEYIELTTPDLLRKTTSVKQM
jgi:hypothetical protein